MLDFSQHSINRIELPLMFYWKCHLPTRGGLFCATCKSIFCAPRPESRNLLNVGKANSALLTVHNLVSSVQPFHPGGVVTPGWPPMQKPSITQLCLFGFMNTSSCAPVWWWCIEGHCKVPCCSPTVLYHCTSHKIVVVIPERTVSLVKETQRLNTVSLQQ